MSHIQGHLYLVVGSRDVLAHILNRVSYPKPCDVSKIVSCILSLTLTIHLYHIGLSSMANACARYDHHSVYTIFWYANVILPVAISRNKSCLQIGNLLFYFQTK